MAKFTFDTTRLKEQVEDNPLVALGVVAVTLTGAAKALNAVTGWRNATTWKHEVKRRERTSK